LKALIVSLPEYAKQANRLLTEQERTAMEDHIALSPEAHPVVVGTGGVRKARWRREQGVARAEGCERSIISSETGIRFTCLLSTPNPRKRILHPRRRTLLKLAWNELKNYDKSQPEEVTKAHRS
jgi:hypothetical protein